VRRTIFQVSGYVLYGLVVFAVLVYVLFPYDLLRQRVIAQWSQGDVRLDIARLSATFPPGLSARQVQLKAQRPQVPGAFMQLDSLRAWPEWLALLAGRLQVHFTGTLYNGRMVGEVRHPLATAAGWEGQARFAALDVTQYPLLQQVVSVRGQLSGDATATLNPAGELQQGKVNFHLQPAVIAAPEGSSLPLQREIPCDTLQGDVALSAQQWQIESLTCQGNDVFVDVRGTLRPQRPWLNSTINLRLQVRSATAFAQEVAMLSALVRQRTNQRGELTFGLRGLLKQPRPVR
jgi:type II secretion system protein N